MRLAKDLLSGFRLALFSSLSCHPGTPNPLLVLSVWQGEDKCKVTALG